MTSVLMTVSEMRSFACWDDRVRVERWGIAREWGTHRDADTVLASNWRVMLARLAELDPGEDAHGIMHAGHCLVGWYDHLLVDWRRVDLVRALEDMEHEIDQYPILDEDDHSALEQELHDDDACGEGCSLCEAEEQDDRSGGYCDCACCDCFDTAIGKAGKALCSECDEAGCEANDGECQRDDAYGVGEDE